MGIIQMPHQPYFKGTGLTVMINFTTAIVSGGCTEFIQAADVVWNAAFKSKIVS